MFFLDNFFVALVDISFKISCKLILASSDYIKYTQNKRYHTEPYGVLVSKELSVCLCY